MSNFRMKTNCEQETRFIQNRLISIERNISELCTAFSQYSKKIAKLRDEGDELGRIIRKYSESEDINVSLSQNLANFAGGIKTLGDYGDSRVRAIDTKVVAEFGKYDTVCKQVKDEVKQIYNVRDKELAKKRQLDRVRSKSPKNRQQIVQAETELIKATGEVTKTLQHVEEKTITFEKHKLHDIKEILLDFTAIEMGYHSKALQVLTKVYEVIQNIDEFADLQDFKKKLRSSESQTAPSDAQFKGSLFKTPSLGSLGAIFSTSHRRHTEGIPGVRRRAQSEENLDSLKTSISDNEETLSDYNNSESISESTVRSADTKRKHN